MMYCIICMIASFKSRTLKRFWEKDDGRKLPANALNRIGQLLDLLNRATEPKDMNLPGLHFHGLSGTSKGRYSIWVTANWRITFAWDDGDAVAVDYEDYH